MAGELLPYKKRERACLNDGASSRSPFSGARESISISSELRSMSTKGCHKNCQTRSPAIFISRAYKLRRLWVGTIHRLVCVDSLKHIIQSFRPWRKHMFRCIPRIDDPHSIWHSYYVFCKESRKSTPPQHRTRVVPFDARLRVPVYLP